jgi:hypothetical protein
MEEPLENEIPGFAGFDPELYPRSYGISPGWRLLILTCGAALTCGALLGLAYFGRSSTHTSGTGATLFLMALFTAFLFLGLYGLLCCLQYQLVLAADAVELVEPLRRRSLRRDEIRGFQVFPAGRGIDVLVLIPKDAWVGKLKIPTVLKTDDAFFRWFFDLVNLDASQAVQSKEDLENTFHPELPLEDRYRRIARLRHLGAVLNGATIVLLLGSLVLADCGYLLLATLAALPWVAIALVALFQPLYRFAGSRNDERVDLTLPLILPGLALTVHAVSTINTVGWQGPLLLACGGGVALTAVAARIDPWFRQQRLGFLLVGVFACVYGYGAGLEINALADRSVAQVHRVKVLEKFVTENSKVKSWYLTLAPWGLVSERVDVSVAEAQYQRTKPGDSVCVQLKSGALQVPWYGVGPCSGGTH